jgi:hypothetical protein
MASGGLEIAGDKQAERLGMPSQDHSAPKPSPLRDRRRRRWGVERTGVVRRWGAQARARWRIDA